MAIIDVVTYNGEKELFEIRYNILKDYVDEFVVVEFDKTFSGREKPWLFEQIELEENGPKINYYRIKEEQYMKYTDLALSSPNTKYGKGASHWIREFCQKESIKDCLTHLKDDDIVFIGDVDEIWDTQSINKVGDIPGKLKLRVYTYYLNNRSTEEFLGTLCGTWDSIKDVCLNHLRSGTPLTSTSLDGWHFTSLHHQLRQKLQDSYTEESYATPWVMENLEENIKSNRDFLGRDFTFKVSEEEWPDYLKNNRHLYQHLLK